VPDAAQAGPTNHRWAEVVALVSHLCLTRVHRDPHGETERTEAALRVNRRRHRVAGPGEGGDYRVALTLLDRSVPVVGCDGVVEHAVMGGDQLAHQLGVTLPRTG
jgi:hypothetical protein